MSSVALTWVVEDGGGRGGGGRREKVDRGGRVGMEEGEGVGEKVGGKGKKGGERGGWPCQGRKKRERFKNPGSVRDAHRAREEEWKDEHLT